MGFSKTEICNMALANLGVGLQIDDFDTDPTPAGTVCRVYYQLALEADLSTFDWWFARKLKKLGVAATNPNSEWPFAYRWESDCLKLQRLLSGARVDTEDTIVSHIGGVDDQGLLIFTDLKDAEAEYTFLPVNAGNFPAYFVKALAWGLAELIAPRLTKEDPYDRAREMAKQHLIELDRAKAQSTEDERRDKPPAAAGVRVRR